MSLQTRAFRPLGNNKSFGIVTTAVSAGVTLPDVPFGTRAFRIVNSGSDMTFIEFSFTGGAAAATTTSMPMLPNTVEVFTVTNDQTIIRVIGAAGGNTLYITPGEGL